MTPAQNTPIMHPITAAAVLLLAALLAACGGQPDPPSVDGKLRVTATTNIVADTVRAIGGEDVAVEALMGPGVDPHLYKATQGDLGKLRDAQIIFYSGLHLEGRMAELLEQMGRDKPTVAVAEAVPEGALFEPPDYEGQPDPHVWFDVALWRHAAKAIRDALIAADPEHAQAYQQRAEAYLAELDALDAWVSEQIAQIPERSRVLVTAHDAFGYFGKAYDMEVRGLQGISTAAEYGLQDVDRLVEMLVERDIKAVFVETSISPRSIEALVEGARARGHDVRVGGELYSDALGAPDSPAGTYTGMVRENVKTIVEALK